MCQGTALPDRSLSELGSPRRDVGKSRGFDGTESVGDAWLLAVLRSSLPEQGR